MTISHDKLSDVISVISISSADASAWLASHEEGKISIVKPKSETSPPHKYVEHPTYRGPGCATCGRSKESSCHG